MGKSKDLVDVLNKIHVQVSVSLPWASVAFAGDVSECYAGTNHFVEQTGKADGPMLRCC